MKGRGNIGITSVVKDVMVKRSMVRHPLYLLSRAIWSRRGIQLASNDVTRCTGRQRTSVQELRALW